MLTYFRDGRQLFEFLSKEFGVSSVDVLKKKSPSECTFSFYAASLVFNSFIGDIFIKTVLVMWNNCIWVNVFLIKTLHVTLRK